MFQARVRVTRRQEFPRGSIVIAGALSRLKTSLQEQREGALLQLSPCPLSAAPCSTLLPLFPFFIPSPFSSLSLSLSPSLFLSLSRTNTIYSYYYPLWIFIGRQAVSIENSICPLSFIFFFFLLDIFDNVKFNGGCSFFIPFDSFNFHLPRDVFLRALSCEEREREKRKKDSERSHRYKAPILSKAFCDLG